MAHFAFLAYLVVGRFIAWRWRRTIWLHVASAAYGLFNVLIGGVRAPAPSALLRTPAQLHPSPTQRT